MEINNELRKYIEENVFPSYEKNEVGHGIKHIMYVIERSLKFASTIPGINLDMVYVVAAYHDIGHYVDAKNHEKVSAEMLEKDESLKKYFTKEQIKIMSEAVHDHRASLDGHPRNIYGKIVSSADRNTSVSAPIKRTYSYRIEHRPDLTIEEVIEESRKYILRKFGESGYALDKMYFKDDAYECFVKDVVALALDKDEFRRKYIEINKLELSY